MQVSSKQLLFHSNQPAANQHAHGENFVCHASCTDKERHFFKKALNSIPGAQYLLLKAELSMFYLLIPLHEW